MLYMTLTQGQRLYDVFFLVNASPSRRSNFKPCRCIDNVMYKVPGNILCDYDLKVRLKGKTGICDYVHLRLQLH